MQNKVFNYQPMINSGSLLPINVFNVGAAPVGTVGIITSSPYAIIKHIRLVNVLTTAATVASVYKGATLSSLAAQSFAFSSVSIPASSYVDWYGQARFETADYMTLWSNLATSTVIQIDGEIGIS